MSKAPNLGEQDLREPTGPCILHIREFENDCLRFSVRGGNIRGKQGGHRNGFSTLETLWTDQFIHYIEKYAGSFQRVFQLPPVVKGDQVEAIFEKGILKVTLPKVEEAKKKEIEVKVK